MKSFRELDVWNKAMELTDLVYEIASKLPQTEKYALGDQIRRAVVSIPSNIAEGFGRDSHKDFAHFLSIARGSLYEVDTQLEIAARNNFIASEEIPAALIEEIKRMLSSLSRRLRATP